MNVPASAAARTRYAAEREAAVQAARQAARLIREHAGQGTEAAVEAKGVHDFVTEADRAAQQRIVETLRAAFPDYDVLAEEGADKSALRPEAEGYRWIIDPIDGTTNFMHGVPPYAVSIALQKGQAVVLGVVLDVAGGELFTAVRGGGLRVDGRPAQVSRTEQLDDSLIATGFPYRSYGHVDLYLKALGRLMRDTRGIRRHGSAAIDLAWTACGRFDGFFETGLDPWDVAAGALLVEEAGGQVTDFRGAPETVFTHQIAASNGRIHEALLEVLRPMREVRG